MTDEIKFSEELHNCDICNKENDVIFHVFEGKIGETPFDLFMRCLTEKPIPTKYCENCAPEYVKGKNESGKELMVIKITRINN